MSRYLFLQSLSITSGSHKVIIIWHKWWLPPRLSNHQSLLPTAVLSRPTLTQTIRQHNQILLLQVVKPLLFRNNWLQKLWFKLYINLILTKSLFQRYYQNSLQPMEVWYLLTFSKFQSTTHVEKKKLAIKILTGNHRAKITICIITQNPWEIGFELLQCVSKSISEKNFFGLVRTPINLQKFDIT